MRTAWQWLANRLRRNRGMKLLALLMAIISWHVIRETIGFEVEIPDIRVEVRSPEGMAVLNQSATTVDVVFRGSQEDIRQLDPRQIRAVVDLSPRADALVQEVTLTHEMMKGAHGVRAVSVRPPRIRVALDREEERRLPVEGRVTGQPLIGQVASVTCMPAVVTVRGPAAKLGAIERLVTQPVDVDGRVESFSRRALVAAPGENWVARIQPAEVQVRVAITADTATRMVTGVPVSCLTPEGVSDRIRVDPPRVDVILSGWSNRLAEVETESVRAFVDCGVVTGAGPVRLPVHVWIPAGLPLSVAAEPAEVDARREMP